MMSVAIRNYRRYASVLLASLLCLPMLVRAGAPTESLRGTVDQVLGILHDAGMQNDSKREKIRALIDQRFDYRAMSQSTLAQNWKQASPEQQQRFVELYARLMQDTYLVLVEEYDNQTVEYGDEKLRRDTLAQVDTRILDDGKIIPVQYKLRLRDGDWLVYDVVIEGVSMVSNYRNSYQQIVRSDGMDGLLARITAKLEGVND